MVGAELVVLDVASGGVVARHGVLRDTDYSIAASPDGQTVVLARSEGALVQKTATGAQVAEIFSRRYQPLAPATGRAFHGLPCHNICSAFSPDGKRFVQIFAGDRLTASPSEAAVYDSASGRRVAELVGATCDGTDVAWSMHGDRIACTSAHGVELWSSDGAQMSPTLPLADAIAFAPDGKTIALVRAGRASVFDIATDRELASFLTLPGRVPLAAALSAGDRYLAVSTFDATRVFDTASGGMVPVPPGHDADVERLVVSGDGRTVVTSGKDGAVLVWDVPTRSIRWVVERQLAQAAPAIAVTPDGKTLAVARLIRSPRNEIDFRRYAIATNKLVAPVVRLMPVTDAATTQLAYAPDGRLYAAAAGFVWRVRDDGTGVDTLATGLVGSSLAFRDRDTVVTGSPMTRLQLSVIDARVGRVARVLSFDDAADGLRGGGVDAMAMTRDADRVLFTVHNPPGTFVVDYRTGKPVGCAPGTADSLAMSPSGAFFVTADHTREAEVVDARALAPPSQMAYETFEDGRQRHVLACPSPVPSRRKLGGHDAGIDAVVIAPGDAFIATASEDATVLLWRVP